MQGHENEPFDIDTLFSRIPELSADPGRQQHHGEHHHLHRGLPASATGIHHGLLLALLRKRRHRQRRQGELPASNQCGKAGVQHADRIHTGRKSIWL